MGARSARCAPELGAPACPLVAMSSKAADAAVPRWLDNVWTARSCPGRVLHRSNGASRSGGFLAKPAPVRAGAISARPERVVRALCTVSDRAPRSDVELDGLHNDCVIWPQAIDSQSAGRVVVFRSTRGCAEAKRPPVRSRRFVPRVIHSFCGQPAALFRRRASLVAE